MTFWDINTEKKFFTEAMKSFASVEQLFYNLANGYFAYIPKKKDSESQTLQSRNTLIGKFTEKWCKDFFQPIAESLGLFAVNNVTCIELGLSSQSDADLAFCTTNERNQKADNIKLIIEVKMSIVNNYQYIYNDIKYVGDFKTHKGTPSILRSDSMLKAVGKSINIRVSGTKSKKIPIIILGNSPISKHYLKKVDFLKQAGIIQGFISLYPNPTKEFIKNSEKMGFQTFDDFQDLSKHIKIIVNSELNYFSSMLPKKELGQIIASASKEANDYSRAEKFLKLIED